MGATCTAALMPFKLPNLKQKNFYFFSVKEIKIDEDNFNKFSRQLFGNNFFLINLQGNLLTQIYLMNQNQRFVDPNFLIRGQNMSKLYDYKKKKMKLYSSQPKQGLSILQQKEVQFSYLSTVLFYLCQDKQFLERRILLNLELNQKQVYAFRLFCNGEQHVVVVDDIVPVFNDSLEYSSMHSKEIWPALLQKAWCKQVGGFDKARGLSPEETFQQITGIPAYSYHIDSINESEIYSTFQNYSRMGYWLCVVAYKQTQMLRPGQVFIIQKIQDNQICLASPYTGFKNPSNNGKQRQLQNNHKGLLKVQFHKFRSLFQHLVVGFARPGYVPISKKLISGKRQEKYFQINVDKKQQMSIRFTQFYDGYLDDSEKSNYQYSSLVTFELYDKNGYMLNFCQGCDRIYSGAHSIYFTKNIFHLFQSGKYFIRLEVDWEYPSRVNSGNIVIYGPSGNVTIEELDGEDLRQNIKKLHLASLTKPNTVVIEDQNKLYQIRFIQKKTNVLIGIHNKTQELLGLEIDFSLSENFRTKYQRLQFNKKVVINLAPQQRKFIELVPQYLKHQFKINPFSVKKLPNIQQ